MGHIVNLDQNYKHIFYKMSNGFTKNACSVNECILLAIVCAFYLEASINKMLWEVILRTHANKEEAIQIFNKMENKKTVNKLQKILGFIGKGNDNSISAILNAVNDLFLLRNRLAHYKEYDEQELRIDKEQYSGDREANRTVEEIIEPWEDPSIRAELVFDKISEHISTVKAFEKSIINRFNKKLSEN